MKPDYSDIVERCGRPLWWDPYGVPRYVEFRPERCSVEGTDVALLRIACQACGRQFVVASQARHARDHRVQMPERTLSGRPSPWDAIGSFHYGDPPRGDPAHNDCVAGPTMNSVPLEILSFWRLPSGLENWRRCREYEFKIRPRR